MNNYQKSMLGEHRFRLVNNRWRCVSDEFTGTPADFCTIFGVYCVPDCTQFLRVNNYEGGVCLEFRDYGSQIRINVTPL